MSARKGFNVQLPVGENCKQYTLTSGLNDLAAMSPDRTPGNLIATLPPSCSSLSSTNAILPNSVILRRFMKSYTEHYIIRRELSFTLCFTSTVNYRIFRKIARALSMRKKSKFIKTNMQGTHLKGMGGKSNVR
jgi:hypothetical protein